MKDALELPDPFEAVPWRDPVLDGVGLDALGPYAEAYWLPIIGPSPYLLARRLIIQPGAWGKGLLATSVGVGHKTNGTSVLERSLARLEGFGLVAVRNEKLYVRLRWSRVTNRMLAKLPPYLQKSEAIMAEAERAA